MNLNLPPLPRTHAVTSTTFKAPPLDGSLTLPEIYDWQRDHSPKHPLFVYTRTDNHDRTEICWDEAVKAIHRAAHWVTSHAGPASTPPPVVAIFAASEAISFFCTVVGVMRAGYTVFMVAPSHTPTGLKRLLTEANATHVFVSGEESLQKVAATAAEDAKADGLTIGVHPMPKFDDLFVGTSADFEAFPQRNYDLDAINLIIHSAGTNNFPKIMKYSNRMVLQQMLVPWYGEVDMTGEILGCHPVPTYGGAGMFEVVTAPSCGFVIATYKPAFPATGPSPDNVFDGFLKAKSTYGFVPPIFLEIWLSDPEKVEAMKEMKGMLYAGRPLNVEVGDQLAEEGVNLFTIYGTTEDGVINNIFTKSPGMDWEWFTFSPLYQGALIPDATGASELVSKSIPSHTPAIIDTEVDGVPGYATVDLLLEHPQKPGHYKLVGRKDDQVVLSTGIKINPGPLENILMYDPYVRSVVIFGTGHPHIGVIVDPARGHIDPKDEAKVNKLKDSIWPSVLKMNKVAPPEGQLTKEMIIVVQPSKPFTYTFKMVPQRKIAQTDYKPEIEALYK
ncbi:acetyl-CoA synthetase-like protein [Rickenella mellea]|uniref:Acetyl-CoA synthetase-like protein n=1 Tax=Rickenella mellea TaxID=50990 RepID=A0A4Y7PRT3_9AGAM|nr:acetyl-CoA synthetase-like protein [Rickenella mellea]